MTPEGQIKKAICEYLSTRRDCFFWVNESVGIFDPRRGIYRKKNSPYQKKGVADILGIYDGVPIAIEVKSKTGRLSPDQSKFLSDFTNAGGIVCVARSIDDVRRWLEPQGSVE
jgi:penicillin-binding protein-related factor A (putative recombinase)